ncbi:MAG: serine hydrolase [bacterium TMED88]|nr:serine hydrolase [Deltaproteobacteria bacterium]OUV35182.1 MAG: serine hydrolase [bacterium TMED88]
MKIVSPESVGLSSARLSRTTQLLEDQYLAPGKIAGCLTLVARRGEVAFFEPQGLMDKERKKPMGTDTLFRIYSMTKPITAVALMMLYEEGLFHLHTPVHHFIPEWKNLRVYRQGRYPNFLTERCDRRMTIKDLFTHMSGLTYGFMERTNVDSAYRRLRLDDGGAEGSTLKDMITHLADIPLEFSPGTAWNYSVSTDVLGYLVEVISGKTLDDYFRERIFEPLGMVDTSFSVPPEKIDRFAANYARRPDQMLALEDDPQDSPYGQPATFFSGGGGLVSTAADYLRFCRMLQNGGELDGARLLGPKTVELMTQNHLPKGQDLTEVSVGLFGEVEMQGTGFGLGFSVNLGSDRQGEIGSAGEYAWGGAASTIFWIDPTEELVVIFMTQLMPSRTYNFRGQLKSLVYSSILE